VHVVLSGAGRVGVSVDGRGRRPLHVAASRAYAVVRFAGPPRTHLLELRPEVGVAAYALTFS
jgi:hypothetical protein